MSTITETTKKPADTTKTVDTTTTTQGCSNASEQIVECVCVCVCALFVCTTYARADTDHLGSPLHRSHRPPTHTHTHTHIHTHTRTRTRTHTHSYSHSHSRSYLHSYSHSYVVHGVGRGGCIPINCVLVCFGVAEKIATTTGTTTTTSTKKPADTTKTVDTTTTTQGCSNASEQIVECVCVRSVCVYYLRKGRHRPPRLSTTPKSPSAHPHAHQHPHPHPHPHSHSHSHSLILTLALTLILTLIPLHALKHALRVTPPHFHPAPHVDLELARFVQCVSFAHYEDVD